MENDQAKRFHWGTALLNSFVTVIAGLFVWMVPAIAKGFQMGFQLGSQGTDQAEIQQQISMTIESMYLDHHATYYMIAGVIMALLVYLYTRKRTKKAGYALEHGIMVALLPVAMSLYFMVNDSVDWSKIVTIVLVLIMGYSGTLTKQNV